jgi:hypothetical protein
MRGIDQILLHVSRKGVEDQRPAGSKTQNDQEAPRVMLEDFTKRTRFFA